MYSRILLATDGSDLSLAACEHGLRLAKSLGVGALAVYASPPFDVPT
jgi:nucleotide-binding universal stress UspA family protein